jgi:hypothetical protein
MSTETLSSQQVKQISRRRFYVFGFVIVAFGFISEIFVEYGVNATFAIDDAVTVVLSVAAIAYFAVTWKKGESLMKRGNDLAFAFGIIILLVTVYALSIETGDSASDDPASIIFGVLLLVNRFI